MPETTATYDAGEVRVRVDGEERQPPAWVREALDAVWRELAGEDMWGDMTATFQGGRLRTVRLGKTIKF